MKKLLMTCAASLALCATTHAEDSWYASLKGGASFPNLSNINTGWEIDGAIGYRLALAPSTNSNELSLRFEFNPGFAQNSHSGGGDPGNLTRLMGNVLIDVPVIDWAYLYGGGGLGGAYYDLPGLGTDFVFAYQGMAGVGFVLTDEFKLEVGYRFFTSNDQHMSGVTVQAPQFHSVEAGIRFEF